MSPLRFLSLFLIIVCLSNQASTQDKFPGSQYLQTFDTPVSHRDFWSQIQEEYGITSHNFISVPIQHTSGTKEHWRSQQLFNGKAIIGAVLKTHWEEEGISSANGRIYCTDHTTPLPTLLREQAIVQAEKYLHRKHQTTDEAFDVVFDHISEVYADPVFPKYSGKLEPCYRLYYSIDQPFDKGFILVNARYGHVVYHQSNICNLGVEGSGNTHYYGAQRFIVDSLSPGEFLLRDPGRNITTLSAKSGQNTTYSSSSKQFMLSPVERDDLALDAHYCTTKFYDMMDSLLGWKGVDGFGGALDPVVHVNEGGAYLNAFWDGQNAYFGNGDCHHDALTTLSVVGHEFMHGVTDYTSRLVYADEPGAINESLSDIFGKSLQYLYDFDNFSWELGPEFSKTKYSRNFRSMGNPNENEDPGYYLGNFWDYGGAVHTNSGVFNRWYYLMIEGETGISEGGKNYSVEPQPMLDVLEAVFLCQQAYLTPTSTLPDLYNLSLLAFEDLFGQNAPQYAAAVEAWKACGLPASPPSGKVDLGIDLIKTEAVSCLDSVYLSPQVLVTNFGDKAVPAGDTLKIDVTLSGNVVFDRSFVLTEALESGSTLSLTLDSALYVESTRFYFYFATLTYDDDDAANNTDTDFFRNYTRSGTDIRLSFSSVSFPECFSDDGHLEIVLRSNGCTEVPKGTICEVVVLHQGDIKQNYSLRISRNLPPGASYDTVVMLPQVDYFSNVECHMSSSADAYPDNNQITFFIRPQKRISGSYLNTFDDNSYSDEWLFNNANSSRIRTHKGESMLVMPGHWLGESNIPCPVLEENIDFGNRGTTRLSACVDVTDLASPALTFDLIQYRYDSDVYPELVNNSSFFRLQYGGVPGFKERVHSLPEGESVKILVNLPEDTRGMMMLEFFAHRGSNAGDDYEVFDANLLDNLEITSTSSTFETSTPSVRVWPNPARTMLYIDGFDAMERMALLDASGRQLPISVTNQSLDVSGLPDGIYFIRGLNSNGSISVVKWVKL